MTSTNWLPGLLALGAALVAAATYVVLSLRRSAPSRKQADAEQRAADLDAQYQSAILQLKELKAEQHHLTPEAFASQRAELERRAADALRAKETQAPAPATAPAAAAPKGFFVRHPELKGAAWGGGVVAFFGLLGVLLFREAKPDAQGDMPRGPMQSQGSPRQEGPDELDRALEHLNQHPEDVETASMVGHELIRRQQWQEALQVTERALGADPFHLENRIHRAVMKAQRGDPAGEAQLQHLADTYPGTQEALLFLASIQAQAGDKAKALDALERYVTVAPPEEQSVELYQAMAQFRRELGKPPAP